MPRLSERELSERRQGMGSTCIVEACNLAPWDGAGPMRLFCEKTGVTSPDDAEEDEDRAAWLEWGHIQEPIIADWYERTHGCQLQLGGPVYSREMPNFWATLDRTVIGANKLVEVKNVGSPKLYSHWDTGSADGIPRYVRAQVTVAMRYHGARETDVVASIGGRPPRVWTVFYDEELSDLLYAGGLRFWQMVVDGQAPPLDATDATRAYLKNKYPANIDRVMREVEDEQVHRIASSRAEAAETEKRAVATKKAADAFLMDRCGDADGIFGSWGKFTWKVNAAGVRSSRFTAARGGHVDD